MERQQIRRAGEEAFDEALTDPRMQLPVLLIEDDPARDDLPPGFPGALHHAHGYAPHPVTTPTFTTLTFRSIPEPWYRTNAAKLTLVGLGLVAAMASVVALLWPSYTPTPQDAGTTTAPAPSPSASPTRSQSAPSVPSPVGLPPAGLPPPPPPPAEPPPPASPPHYYPRYTEPSKQKPRVDVTRTPISVAPTVRQQPRADSSAPGDGPKRGWPW